MSIIQVTYFVCDVCKTRYSDASTVSSVSVLGKGTDRNGKENCVSVSLDMCYTCKCKLHKIVKENFADIELKEGVITKLDIKGI